MASSKKVTLIGNDSKDIIASTDTKSGLGYVDFSDKTGKTHEVVIRDIEEAKTEEAATTTNQAQPSYYAKIRPTEHIECSGNYEMSSIQPN
ncbi:hypothetical protein BBP40_009050 [Aspergillus hancockii]|nr:hypothetical protein BBP40_009050 [Aspergillus hancockii]